MKLSYLFSDGMVLQRGKRNYIWGETSPEIIVTGILDGRKFNTKADTHGMFVAELPDLPVGGPYCMEINGDEKRVIRNIMSGDVFLLGGQSNMELRIKFVTERFADEIKKINRFHGTTVSTVLQPSAFNFNRRSSQYSGSTRK